MHCHRTLGYHFQALFRRLFSLNSFKSLVASCGHLRTLWPCLCQKLHIRGILTTAKKTYQNSGFIGHKVGLHNVHEVTGSVWASSRISLGGSMEMHPPARNNMPFLQALERWALKTNKSSKQARHHLRQIVGRRAMQCLILQQSGFFADTILFHGEYSSASLRTDINVPQISKISP